jgi:hypothetical protein
MSDEHQTPQSAYHGGCVNAGLKLHHSAGVKVHH